MDEQTRALAQRLGIAVRHENGRDIAQCASVHEALEQGAPNCVFAMPSTGDDEADEATAVRTVAQAADPPFRQRLWRPVKLTGKNLVFRQADPTDAEFILSLRTDPEKSKYLSKVSGALEDQVRWLIDCAGDASQVYFIIETLDGRRLGTVRLYDVLGDSFCWGSWILSGERPSGAAVESACMVYRYALALGFTRSRFDVRKGNESVWKFHERFGAKRTGETELDYLYDIDKPAILDALERYRKQLPEFTPVWSHRDPHNPIPPFSPQ